MSEARPVGNLSLEGALPNISDLYPDFAWLDDPDLSFPDRAVAIQEAYNNAQGDLPSPVLAEYHNVQQKLRRINSIKSHISTAAIIRSLGEK